MGANFTEEWIKIFNVRGTENGQRFDRLQRDIPL
jgi:hypothetical protein